MNREEYKSFLNTAEIGDLLKVTFEPFIVVSKEVEKRTVEITEVVEKPARSEENWFVLGRSVSDTLYCIEPHRILEAGLPRAIMKIGTITEVEHE